MVITARSYYSLRFGIFPPERLALLAFEGGFPAIALCDINNSAAIPDFTKACKNTGVQPIAGIEFREENKILYTGIALNNDGFSELNEFPSTHNINKIKLPETPPQFSNAIIIYPFETKNTAQLHENEYIGVRASEQNKLLLKTSFRHKYLAWNPITFQNSKEFLLHKHLAAIAQNTVLTNINNSLLAHSDEVFSSYSEIESYFSANKFLVGNSNSLLKQINFSIEFKKNKNKAFFTQNINTDRQLLRQLAYAGIKKRFPNAAIIEKQRVDHELQIIENLGFEAYFLITWDIIQFAKNQGFYHVGRGSGANSVVAYCLGITDVNPIELNLYFERFINPKRTSPPDFDIDFSWRDRDKVQQYIFDKYSYKHCALLGATSTFKGKSIFRELGKVYGLPKEDIDNLVFNPYSKQNSNEITAEILKFAALMNDFPNIRSIHAGGILISEKPLSYYTALDMPPKGFPTTQWDMYVAEDLGFEKLDILSQRGIGHINECVEIVKKNRGESIDIHNITAFVNDSNVNQKLKNAKTIGCFYIESPAMRGLLTKLRCDNYLTLVAASSIIRPGVARSGMMKEYIKRFHNPSGFQYIHSIMKEQLAETYGIMVYQEDVMKICHHFAGLDLADADVLRRAMSGKFRARSEFEAIVDKFHTNCRARSYSENLISEVWRQIESFAGYSFSKAHSASYAVESYQSLFLKTYFPTEFMVAVINNYGGFYRTWGYINEAKMNGSLIELPCINTSEYQTSISENRIFLGFALINNLEYLAIKEILKERKRNGKFSSLQNFYNRTQLGIEQLIILIRINSFRFTKKSKAALLWEAHLIKKTATKISKQSALFELPDKNFKIPEFQQNKIEDAFDEIELLNFPITLSYFELLQTKFRSEIYAEDFNKHLNKKVKLTGLLVALKYVKTIKKELMHFGTFFDVKGYFFDTVHFPAVIKEYPFTGDGVYLIYGQIVDEFGFQSINVEKMARLPLVRDPRQ